MQRLSDRLMAAAEFVTPDSRAADIGTDHGFLPIYLVQSGRCTGAVAMDIRKGPLQRAAEHIAKAGLEAEIQTRLSDGMKELARGEVDSIIIAGMGGLTMIRILKNAQDKLAGSRELILGPQSDTAKVRRFLRESGWCIDRENLVWEDGKFYPILHAALGVQEHIKNAKEAYVQDIRRLFLESRVLENPDGQLFGSAADEELLLRLADQYGACLIRSRHPVLRQLLARDEKRALAVLKRLESGGRIGEKHKKRRLEVERQLEDIKFLQEVMAGKTYQKENQTGE